VSTTIRTGVSRRPDGRLAMTDSADSRLQRLLGTEALADVRRRLRRQFERLEPGASPPRLRLTHLDPAAHAALCQLAGRPSGMARSMLLDVAELDGRLRSGGLADSLRDALERLDGPIVAKASQRRALLARWTALMSEERDARLHAWLGSRTASKLLKRLARDPDRAARLLATAEAVLSRLPAAGLTRSQLAAQTLGDAHALDAGRPVATIVLATWRHQTVDRSATDDEARPRDVWASAGVLVNELARPVLVLNLPCATGASVAPAFGEPGFLSLRQLMRSPPSWQVAGRDVYVCENPNIVAIAADRLGVHSAPLVCTDGMPAAAQRTLLDQLTAAGARLYYHGDYDWAGIRIGNVVMRHWRALPWRYRAGDYRRVVEECSSGHVAVLDTAAVDASWDAELGPAMRERGLAVAEETVVEELVADLGAAKGPPEVA